MVHVPDRRDDQVRCGIGATEVTTQPLRVQRFDGLLGAENRPAQRMVSPETLGEQFVDQVVGRVLDHLDLFEDHLLLALDVIRR